MGPKHAETHGHTHVTHNPHDFVMGASLRSALSKPTKAHQTWAQARQTPCARLVKPCCGLCQTGWTHEREGMREAVCASEWGSHVKHAETVMTHGHACASISGSMN